MYVRKRTSSSVKHTRLNTSPNVAETETLDAYHHTMKDTVDTLLNEKISSTEILVDHLLALVLVTYINMTVENKNLNSDYKSSTRVCTRSLSLSSRPIWQKTLALLP